MNLYLLRHAIAVERGTAGFDDDSIRPLTPDGRKKMERIAEAMLALDLEFDWILTSPFVRARQTAEIVAEQFGLQKKLVDFPALADDGVDALVEAVLEKYARAESLLLVGHEPYLSELAAFLVSSSGMSMIMKKGGLAKLTVEALRSGRSATLEWLMTPAQLRRIR